MRVHLRRAAAATLLILGAGSAIRCGGAPPPPPPVEPQNLVLVTVSSLRGDRLGIYGYPRNISPRLDLFAAEGALLLEARTPAPETGPAATAVLTSLDPARAAHGSPARLLPFSTMATELATAGYRTVAAVSHPAVAAELGFARGFEGFEEFWDRDPREADRAVAAHGVAVVSAAAPGELFFLWLHLSAPEPPHDDFAEVGAALAGDGLTPDRPRFRTGPEPAAAEAGGPDYGEAMDRYDAAVGFIDAAFGQILDALAGNPAAGPTVVMVVGLHGESLGEHAPRFHRPRGLFRETLHVPFLLGRVREAPGEDSPPPFSPGARFTGPVSIADVLPTAFGLIGATAPEPPDPGSRFGASLLPALAGEELRPHRRLYARSAAGLFSIFDGRLKMLRVPVPGQDAPQFALYNQVRDPNEAENRYPQGRSSTEPLRAELETRRLRTVSWAQENARNTGDPGPPGERLSEALASRGYR